MGMRENMTKTINAAPMGNEHFYRTNWCLVYLDMCKKTAFWSGYFSAFPREKKSKQMLYKQEITVGAISTLRITM